MTSRSECFGPSLEDAETALPGVEPGRGRTPNVLYQGHRYVLRQAPEGWWAIILTLEIETMFCRDAAAATAAAETVIDGFLRAEQAAARRH